jgi:lipid-A-disaccharide synthase
MTGGAHGAAPPAARPQSGLPDDTQTGPLIFLVAGEPSGDLLGARLMAALTAQTGGRVRFAGVGGAAMAREGLNSLVPIAELSVMGLLEVIPHLPRILGHLRRTVQAARRLRPAAVVTIDSPNFSLEVAKRLAGGGAPLIHFVAPSVWAWKPWRARRIARYLDHLLTLLPFEPPYFERHGLATTFVGHPAVEAPAGGDPRVFRQDHGIPEAALLLCVLPGSRRGETARLLPIFRDTLALLRTSVPDLHVVVPTVPNVADDVAAAARDWPVPAAVLRDPAAKYDAFAASDAALAASGTVAVELAVAGVPSVIAYRLSPLTGFLAKRLLKVRYVSLPNLLLDRAAQPEFLQGHCTPANLAGALERLLTDPAARAAQKADAAAAVAQLTSGGDSPSQRAARCILDLIATGAPARNG